jgi:hypothetical protein
MRVCENSLDVEVVVVIDSSEVVLSFFASLIERDSGFLARGGTLAKAGSCTAGL